MIVRLLLLMALAGPVPQGTDGPHQRRSTETRLEIRINQFVLTNGTLLDGIYKLNGE